MLPKNRRTFHPGTILKEEFLDIWGLTAAQFAELVGEDKETIKKLISGEIGIDDNLAWKLHAATGTTMQLWFNLQRDFDHTTIGRRGDGTD